jgi:serine/threonine protein kinase
VARGEAEAAVLQTVLGALPEIAKALAKPLAPARAAPADSVAATWAAPLTTAGAIVGTLGYMSPEQLDGQPAHARSDLFSLGAILHEMATGRRVFEGASPASLIGQRLRGAPRSSRKCRPLQSS